MKKIFVALVLIASFSASAQIKIGGIPADINAGSLLELESSTKGLKFPQVALTDINLWAPLTGTRVMGMTVYNIATATGLTPGLYTNNGAVWVKNEAALTAPVLKIKLITSLETNYFSGGEDIFIITIDIKTFKLPSALDFKNRVLYIRNEFTNSIFYSGDPGTDGPVGISSIPSISAQMVISDGTKWHMIAGKQ